MFDFFPNCKQLDSLDCGPAALATVCKHYKINTTIAQLRILCDKQKTGTSFYQIKDAAEKIGFLVEGLQMSFDNLQQMQLPIIAHVHQNHFTVVYKITPKNVYLSDPAVGKIKMTHEGFKSIWNIENDGLVLSLLFINNSDNKAINLPKQNDTIIDIFKNEMRKYVKLFGWILAFFLVTSSLQFLLPKLSQRLFDDGIANKNITVIKWIAVVQLFILVTTALVDFIKSFLFYKISNRININLVSQFYKKIFKLPISFLDKKNVGDILQRITDHHKIENFLTYNSIQILINIVSIIVFSIALLLLKAVFFLVFLGVALLSILILILYNKKRKALEAERFQMAVANQDEELEIVYGLQEIKLQNAEVQKIESWKQKQEKLLVTNNKIYKINQQQQLFSTLLPQSMSIVLSIWCAFLVVQQQLTIGQLFAIGFIVSQLSSPVYALFQSYIQYNEVQMSKERINDFYDNDDEEDEQITQQPIVGDIEFKNISFKYQLGEKYPYQLNNINCSILHQKTTAIVGMSGSGKTTLVKLLLQFYQPSKGTICNNNIALSTYNIKAWRNAIGIVMQDGYIFSDTIKQNICFGVLPEKIDLIYLNSIIEIACLSEFVNKLPYGLETKIGHNGTGLSAGQKQRILIARALYKNPEILIFDEATNALDSINEKNIIQNIRKEYPNKTIIVIAHRLSTIKHADKIIVLDKGAINNQGNHEFLINNSVLYKSLIISQT